MLILMEFLIMFTVLDRRVLISGCCHPTVNYMYVDYRCVFCKGIWTLDTFRDLTDSSTFLQLLFCDVRTPLKKEDGSPLLYLFLNSFPTLMTLTLLGFPRQHTPTANIL